jgi:hypothetical protein
MKEWDRQGKNWSLWQKRHEKSMAVYIFIKEYLAAFGLVALGSVIRLILFFTGPRK